MPNITKRLVDATKPVTKRVFVWDDEVKGFGLLVLPSGVKSFVLQYRTGAGRERRLTLGRYGTMTPDQARDMARELKMSVAKGDDPVGQRQALKTAPTVNDLMDRYLKEHVAAHNAARTEIEVKRLVDRHIRPALGKHKVASITRQDVIALHKSMSGTPRQANFTLSVISKAFNLAEAWGMRSEHSNPARLVKRYKEQERERFLTADELTRLGASLEEAGTKGLRWVIKAKGKAAKHLAKDAKERRSTVNPMALAAIRLLLFTGARLSEVLELRWDHIDMEAGTIALPSRKGEGRKAHPVSAGALAVIAEIEYQKGTPFVFPSPNSLKKHMSKEVMEGAWQRVRAHAGLDDVRLHDLRHTVGTYASQAGSNAFMISHLLRHTNVAITNRYVNPDADPIRAVSDQVGERIEAGLRGNRSGEVIPLKHN